MRPSEDSFAARRSTEIPPNQANIDPPRNAEARLSRSMPSKIATSATSSLSESPRERNTRFTIAAAAIRPAQKPMSVSPIARSNLTDPGYSWR